MAAWLGCGLVDIRPAQPGDADAIASIYNEGIAERQATFQTRLHEGSDFAARIEEREPMIVAAEDGAVLGAAWIGAYSDRSPYYAGVGEATVYVAGTARRGGTGKALLDALAVLARDSGRHKLVAKIFTTNRASLALFCSSGYRDVGVHLRHGRLDGEWKDVAVVELSLDLGGDVSES